MKLNFNRTLSRILLLSNHLCLYLLLNKISRKSTPVNPDKSDFCEFALRLKALYEEFICIFLNIPDQRESSVNKRITNNGQHLNYTDILKNSSQPMTIYSRKT